MTNWNGTWFTGGIQVRQTGGYCGNAGAAEFSYTAFPTGPMIAWARPRNGFGAFGTYTADAYANGFVRVWQYNNAGAQAYIDAFVLGV